MHIDRNLRPQAIYEELVRRFREYRISDQMTQSELADKAFISKSTLGRFEKGNDISMKAFIELVYALDLQDNLNLLIPDPDDRPSYHLPERKERKRVRHKKSEGKTSGWKWGDER